MTALDAAGLWWLKPALYLIAAGGIAAVGWHYGATHAHAQDASAIADLREKITATERAAYTAAQQAITRNLETERRAAQTQADIETKYQQEINDATAKTARLTRQLRTGDLRMYVPIVTPNPNGLPTAAASASVSDDPSPYAVIQPATASDLTQLAADADAIATQLGACQAIINADRLSINGAAK